MSNNPQFGFSEFEPSQAQPNVIVNAADRAIAAAVAGELVFNVNSDATVSLGPTQWAYATIRITDTDTILTADRSVIYPDVDTLIGAGALSRLRFEFVNDTAFGITVKRSGQTGVTVPAGEAALLRHNGTDVQLVAAGGGGGGGGGGTGTALGNGGIWSVYERSNTPSTLIDQAYYLAGESPTDQFAGHPNELGLYEAGTDSFTFAEATIGDFAIVYSSNPPQVFNLVAGPQWVPLHAAPVVIVSKFKIDGMGFAVASGSEVALEFASGNTADMHIDTGDATHLVFDSSGNYVFHAYVQFPTDVLDDTQLATMLLRSNGSTAVQRARQVGGTGIVSLEMSGVVVASSYLELLVSQDSGSTQTIFPGRLTIYRLG